MPFITRNSKTLASFVKYCEENPGQRFWQALRNWALFNRGTDYIKILVSDVECEESEDTFNWEGRFRDEN